MKAEIITVGNEILSGATLNSNAAVLGRRLLEVGVVPQWGSVVADDAQDIARAVLHSVERAGVVIVTGGLGPTPDDVTREAIAAAADRPLVLREDLLDDMRRGWTARGTTMPESNTRQAFLPARSSVIPNPVGSAPGFRLKIAGTDVFVLPGVPAEMSGMLRETVLPALAARARGRIRRFRTLHTIGWPESAIAERISRRLRCSGEWSLAYLPQRGGVDLRVGAAGSPARVNRVLADAVGRIRRILGPAVYGADGGPLEALVGRQLLRRGWTVSVAESCTGGLLSNLLTHVPGSSAYFDRAVVAYSNRAKTSLLGVSPKTLRARGAVSGEVAVEMARGVKRLSRTTLGISVTGIAGPGGGTKNKPVGLVYVGLAVGRSARAFRFQFPGDRRSVKYRSSRAALNLLRLYLRGGTLDAVETGMWRSGEGEKRIRQDGRG